MYGDPMSIDTAPSVSVPDQRAVRGGRPRDPELAGRVLHHTLELLAERGTSGLTMDDVAAHASVGKASIYRRWRTQDELLADAIAELGPRDVAWPEPGDLRSDLTALLLATVGGRNGHALAGVLSDLPLRPALRAAYVDGPLARLNEATAVAIQRAQARGEQFPGGRPLQTAVALLQHDMLVFGIRADHADIEDAIDATRLCEG